MQIKSKPAVSSGLSERLISQRLISAAGAAEVAELARAQGATFIQEILDGNHVESIQLARIVSEEYGVPLFDLAWLCALDLFIPLDALGQKKTWALPASRGWWGGWGYRLRWVVQMAG